MDGSSGDTAIWAGIDIGTQSVRALLASDDGTVLARGAVALSGRREGDRHEQDPEDWWSAVVRALQVVTREIDASAVRGVACCATSGTVLFVETAGTVVDDSYAGPDPARAVTPALMYDDARAAEYAARLDADPVPGWTVVGMRPQRSWGLAKALWLLDHHVLPEGARLAHQVDVVNSRLIGEPAATDWSHALKSGVDLSLERPDWTVESFARYGIEPRRLPKVVAPGSLLGLVSSAAARVTGLPEGTPVYAGLTDGCAAQVAAGALHPGAWNFVLGTTLVLKGCAPSPVLDPTGAVYSHRSPDGTWWPGGASSAGAAPLTAIVERAAARGASAEVDRLLAALGKDPAAWDRASSGREPSPVQAYPLMGRGERFPIPYAEAEPILFGAPRDPVDEFAAVLQGVGFVARLCLDHVQRLGAPVGTAVTLTGGGARSVYWPGLIARILGREVVVPEVADGAFGMAILAASGAKASDGGPFDLPGTAAAMVRYRARWSPEDAEVRWSEAYDRWTRALRGRGWPV